MTHGIEHHSFALSFEGWQQQLIPGAAWDSCAVEGMAGIEISHTQERDVPVYLARACASTMDVAWALEAQGRFPSMAWVIAQAQGRGRGQLGRKWDSVEGNLYASLRLPDPAGKVGGLLSLAVALTVSDGLTKLGIPCEIKWPNDLLVGGHKVGGILIEQHQNRLVAGIGINLRSPEKGEEYRGHYRIPAGGLSGFGMPLSAPGLWRRLVGEIHNGLMSLVGQPKALVRRLDKVLAFKLENVLLEQDNGESRPVRIMGVHDNGGIRIQTPNGVEIIESGRIIPRIMT